MTQEIRWHYRFRNFSRAYSLLSEALENGFEELNQLEKEGVVQRFEYTFELAWNTLKDRLEYDGVVLDLATPRNVIREATASGLISDGQSWIDMLTDHNTMSHQYSFAVFEEVVRNVCGSYLSAFGSLYLRLGEELLA